MNDYVTRQFINLTKKFRRELPRLATGLANALEKQAKAIRDAAQTQERQQGPPKEVVAHIHFPESIQVRQETHSANQEKKYRLITVFVSALGAGIVTIYATLVFWQYKQMIGATAAAQNAAIEARNANTIAQKALQSVQRAFVFPSDPELIRDTNGSVVVGVILRFSWENSGVTPTRNMRTHYSFDYLPKGLPPHFAFPDYWSLGNPHINTPVALGPHSKAGVNLSEIPAASVQALQHHQTRLFIWGWARYRDIFDQTREHITETCYEVTGFIGDPLNASQPGQTKFDNCPVHNCFDEECSANP